MKQLKHILALILVLALALPALALADDDTEITVTGAASISLVADKAEVTLAVGTFAPTATEAIAQNADQVASLRKAMTDAGVSEDKLTTASFTVYSEYTYEDGSERFAGYRVSHTLTLYIDDVKQVGLMLDTAFAAGATNCYNIRFLSSGSLTAMDEALANAVTDGRRKAELIAKAAGLTLGQLDSIIEGFSNYGELVQEYADAESTAGAFRNKATGITAGPLTVTANVTMTFKAR